VPRGGGHLRRRFSATITLYDRNTQIPNRVGGTAQAAAGLCTETAFLPGDCDYNLSANQLPCRP
jgi:hypothetical protein